MATGLAVAVWMTVWFWLQVWLRVWGLVAGLTAGLGAIPSEDKKWAPMCLDMANNGETRSFSIPKTLAVGLSVYIFV